MTMPTQEQMEEAMQRACEEQAKIMMKQELLRIRKEIDAERVSYGEIAFLQEHQKEIKELGDIILAQWAGIPEEEWNE